MTANGILQIAIFFLVILALTVPLGRYMARIYESRPRRLEKWIYKLCGIDALKEETWTEYAAGLLIFSVITLLFTYALQRLQQWFPLNPLGLGNVGPDSSFNTAVSFTTNTNWQSYTPETTMTYLTQMLGLATHNFFSAAAGIAVAIALIRGFTRHSVRTLGNFWVD